MHNIVLIRKKTNKTMVTNSCWFGKRDSSHPYKFADFFGLFGKSGKTQIGRRKIWSYRTGIGGLKGIA
jgi:hypothetical protein